jgi:hypothetical protein
MLAALVWFPHATLNLVFIRKAQSTVERSRNSLEFDGAGSGEQ